MPNPLAAAAYTCLTVALFVTEPSHIPPGTTGIQLAPGTYLYRTGHDTQIHLDDRAAVRVVAAADDKDGDWPDPPKVTSRVPTVKGDTAPDRIPTLTVS
jgi:hypothetical protein